MTIEEMSILYNIDCTRISRYIRNIYKKGRLDKNYIVLRNELTNINNRLLKIEDKVSEKIGYYI